MRAGISTPTALLHLERLRFLGQLVRHGPYSAWALLSWYAGFCQALRDASSWLLAAVRTTCALSDIDVSWPVWQDYIQRSPGKWKALLKRAEGWHALASAQQAPWIPSWTLEMLDALQHVIACARRGFPVCLRFPVDPSALEPLSSWLCGMTGEGRPALFVSLLNSLECTVALGTSFGPSACLKERRPLHYSTLMGVYRFL